MDKVFGYACTRGADEKLDVQVNLLKGQGIKEEDIFIDRINKVDYTKYQMMKEMLNNGDEVIFCNIDKIGVSIVNIYDELEWYKENGVKVKILELQILNATALSSELIQSILTEICYFLSVLEKKRIRRKQALGIQRAKKEGKYKGRKRKPIKGFDEVNNMIDSKEISVLEGCRRLGINSSTYYRRINKK